MWEKCSHGSERELSVNGIFNVENIKFPDAEEQSKRIEIVSDKGRIGSH